MRIKFLIFLLLFEVVVSFGCIESLKSPASNETNITTPAPTLFPTEQKLPSYNETRHLKINDTFETWSRGYYANYSDWNPFFKVITNYSDWIEFLDNQGYPPELEGTLFPGVEVKPRIIEPADFNENFIIVAMMGLKGITEAPEIEITNISRINSTVDVTVRMYNPTAGAAAMSSPYHIVIVKREILPKGNFTFVFMDEGNKLGKVDMRPMINLTYVPNSVEGNTNFTVRWRVSEGTSREVDYTEVHWSYMNTPMKFSTDLVWDINYTVVRWGYKSGSTNMSDYPWVSKIQTGKTPMEFIANINAPAGGSLYIRAYAIIDDVQVYSPEYQIRIE